MRVYSPSSILSIRRTTRSKLKTHLQCCVNLHLSTTRVPYAVSFCRDRSSARSGCMGTQHSLRSVALGCVSCAVWMLFFQWFLAFLSFPVLLSSSLLSCGGGVVSASCLHGVRRRWRAGVHRRHRVWEGLGSLGGKKPLLSGGLRVCV